MVSDSDMWFCWLHQAVTESLHWGALQLSANENQHLKVLANGSQPEKDGVPAPGQLLLQVEV